MQITIQTPESGINWGVKVLILKEGTTDQVGHIEIDIDGDGGWVFYVFDEKVQVHPEPILSYHQSKLVAEYHFHKL